MLETIYNRRSTKKYLDKEVEKDLIDKVIKAGTLAPTGRNLQSPIIIAITNKEVRDKLAKINAGIMGVDTDPFYGAPVVLVVLAKKDNRTAIYDGSCVMENMLLAAESLGLGACWIHRAKEEFETEYGLSLLKELGIEEEYVGVGNLILGYKAEYQRAEKKLKDNWVYYID